jgi:serine/threonine protein kinase
MDLCQHCGGPSGSGRFCGNCGIARVVGGAPTVPLVAAAHFWQPLPVGATLQSRYHVHRLMSRGSFGAVYEVSDDRFSWHSRALKEFVPVVLSADEFAEARSWFLREAEMLGSLSDPAIPRVWDSFEEHGRLYIVMQLVEGRTLEEVIAEQQGHGLPPALVLAWAQRLCDVLEYLHGHQPPILFRDLKPANIMVGSHDHLTLIDFGIATRFVPQRIGTTIGTPGFAPPEQYQGLAEPRSDLYALAATLHYALTGRDPSHELPFSFPPLNARALGIPVDVARAIGSALSLVISDRPATAAAFRELLASGQHGAMSPSNIPRLVRYDLRHASRVANQPWTRFQREVFDDTLHLQDAAPEVSANEPAAQEGVATLAGVALKVSVLWQQVERLSAVGHYAKALAALDQLLQVAGDDAELWREKGRLLRQAGRPVEAITAFKEALQRGGDRADVLSSMGWCLAHIGQHQEALAVLERALVLDPSNATAWSAKGWTLVCLKRYHEALRALDEATQIDPDLAEAWRTRGYCLERLGQHGEALRAFQRAQRAG